MSGNVAEWEDSFDGATATSKCRLRGGSYLDNHDPTALSCAAERSVLRVPTNDVDLEDVGFRCCQYCSIELRKGSVRCAPSLHRLRYPERVTYLTWTTILAAW